MNQDAITREEVARRKKIIDDVRRMNAHMPVGLQEDVQAMIETSSAPEEAAKVVVELVMFALQFGRKLVDADQFIKDNASPEQRFLDHTGKPMAKPSSLILNLVGGLKH